MKTKNQFFILFSLLLLYGCANDEKIQKELDPALRAAENKLAAWCNCVTDSAKVNQCIDLGKAFSEEREKYMALLEEYEQKYGADNEVVGMYVSGNQKLGYRANDCNGKFLDRGGEKWW